MDWVCWSVYTHTEPGIFISPLVRLHLQHYIQLWCLQHKKDMDLLEQT